MAEPRRATTTKAGRFYTWNTEEYPSVTTIISDGVPKPALVAWGPKMAAEFVADNLDMLNVLIDKEHGKQLVVDMVKGSPYRTRDAGAAMGTLLHEYAEAYVRNLPLPKVDDKLAGFVRSLELFLEDWQPEFVRTEATVYNRHFGYAGTFDFLANIEGHGLVLGDWKTTKPGKQGHGIYPETALQLNAYAGAEFIGEPDGTMTDMPKVDALLAINIRPDGYHVIPVERSDRAMRAFLYCQQTARFVREGNAFVGEPLAPPIRGAA